MESDMSRRHFPLHFDLICMCEKFAGRIAARSIGIELPGLDSFAPDCRRQQRHDLCATCSRYTGKKQGKI